VNSDRSRFIERIFSAFFRQILEAQNTVQNDSLFYYYAVQFHTNFKFKMNYSEIYDLLEPGITKQIKLI
jgi:hypothetical protein